MRKSKRKLIANSGDDLIFLYDLENDKQERKDLKEEHPDIVEHLLSKLAEWEKELIPPLWPGVMEYEQEIEGVKMRFAL